VLVVRATRIHHVGSAVVIVVDAIVALRLTHAALGIVRRSRAATVEQVSLHVVVVVHAVVAGGAAGARAVLARIIGSGATRIGDRRRRREIGEAVGVVVAAVVACE